MELKPGINPYNAVTSGRFNRTFMELKLLNNIFSVYPYFCFNRTFMELKQNMEKQNKFFEKVLIGPSWN